jgi:hypothetical protein
MKTKYIIFVFLFPILIITSCKRETDRIFEENATARMTEAIADAYKVLQSSETGWLMKYYPSEDLEFGGYTIFAKFISNGQVMLTSDINEDVITSTYGVIHDSGPVLTFNGYNDILHLFSEPGMDNGGHGADDTGMKGDFEFIVLKATADSVVLKGKKSGNEIVMLPLQNDLEVEANAFREGAEFFNYLPAFELENTKGERTFLNQSYNTLQDLSQMGTDLFSYRIVPNGLEFYKEHEVDGVKFSSMTFHEPTAEYPKGYLADESGKIKFVVISYPLNMWFEVNSWGFAYSKVGETGQYYWDLVKSRLDNDGLILNAFNIGYYYGYEALSFILQNGVVQGGVTYTITPVSGSKNRVTLAFGGSLLNLQNFTAAYWNNYVLSFHTPLNGRTFEITAIDTEDEPNEILLTDVANSDNTFQVVLGTVLNPFDN